MSSSPTSRARAAIVKVNVFSGLATTLVSSPDPFPDPQWAPDNSKIAYLKTTAGATDVWTMNPDGTGQTQLTTVGTVAAPSTAGGAIAWSADSSKLAFVVGPSPYAIWVVNANGTGAHAITTPTSSPLFSAFGPSWSPDGSQILFIKNGATLELMNADGSNIHPLNQHETFSSASLRTTAWTSTATEYPASSRGPHRGHHRRAARRQPPASRDHRLARRALGDLRLQLAALQARPISAI